MITGNTEIYHLYHSGVAVKNNNQLLVFDYYKDRPARDKRELTQGVVTAADLKKAEEVFVFVSHSHSDHFNPVIFDWEDHTDNINYILSDDVSMRQNRQNQVSVKPDQNTNVENISVQTYGSTDRGVSFLVKSNDLKIFHAGDLNWWHWKNNSKA